MNLIKRTECFGKGARGWVRWFWVVHPLARMPSRAARALPHSQRLEQEELSQPQDDQGAGAPRSVGGQARWVAQPRWVAPTEGRR